MPAQGLYRNGRTDGYHRGSVLARGREMPCSTKVELFGAHARQGKETVHLVGNRRELVGRQGRRPPALVMGVDLTAVVDRDSLK